MAPHAGCQRLELDVRQAGVTSFNLVPGKRLSSLPHVRRMRVRLDGSTMGRFSLPMPRLEELSLPETKKNFAPLAAYCVWVSQARNARSAPFPALRRLSVTTAALVWHTSTSERTIAMRCGRHASALLLLRARLPACVPACAWSCLAVAAGICDGTLL